jgi:hypothetical protein
VLSHSVTSKFSPSLGDTSRATILLDRQVFKSVSQAAIVASIDSSILSEITGTDPHIIPSPKTLESAMAQSSSPAAQRRDSVFLVLAPVLSTDYPSPISSSVSPPPSTDAAASVPEVQPVLKERRSSSVSSGDGLKRKVLKLGPVHGGQHASGDSDFVDLDEE